MGASGSALTAGASAGGMSVSGFRSWDTRLSSSPTEERHDEKGTSRRGSKLRSMASVALASAEDLSDGELLRKKESVVKRMLVMGMASIGIAPKEREVEKEIEKQKQRFKPDSLAALTQRTHFDRREIQMLYRGFKENCPSGLVSRQKFQEIFQSFFAFGDCTEYSRKVFDSFDDDGNGEISFEEFVEGLSVLCRGTDEQRLMWVFKVYDHDRKGYFIKQDLFRLVSSVYDLLGQSIKPQVRGNDIMRHVTQIFDTKFDPSRTGKVSQEEFLAVCKDDPVIQKSLSVFTVEL